MMSKMNIKSTACLCQFISCIHVRMYSRCGVVSSLPILCPPLCKQHVALMFSLERRNVRVTWPVLLTVSRHFKVVPVHAALRVDICRWTLAVSK